MRARINTTTVAESSETVLVEGNHYFPSTSVDHKCLRSVDTTTVCPWKGTANYYDVVVDGATYPNAAWFYPEPSDAARAIELHIAFDSSIASIEVT